MKQREKLFSVSSSDCEWQFFRAGGKGGQNVNKRSTAVRVIHHPSGAVGEAREYRTQLENRRSAWHKMASTKEFKAWVKLEASKKCHMVMPINEYSHYSKPTDENLMWWIDKQLTADKIQVEIFSEGMWKIERK